jgi:hypothetical protein
VCIEINQIDSIDFAFFVFPQDRRASIVVCNQDVHLERKICVLNICVSGTQTNVMWLLVPLKNFLSNLSQMQIPFAKINRVSEYVHTRPNKYDVITFKKDPTNRYGQHTIEAFNEAGEKIGYLNTNSIVHSLPNYARDLDSGLISIHGEFNQKTQSWWTRNRIRRSIPYYFVTVYVLFY